MRTRGWGGAPPATDEEARERVVLAATRCVQRVGADKTTLADVAAELSVTRQTVYRYFTNLPELLAAVSEAGASEFLDELTAAITASAQEPAEALVDAMLYTLERLPLDPRIGLLLQSGDTELFTRGAASSTAMRFGTALLHRFPIDWEALGYDEAELEGLTELMLRLFLSLLQHPAEPPRSTAELRAYLLRWLGPAVTP